MFSVLFDEDGPGVSSSLKEAVTPFPGLVSKSGGVPASLRGGTMAGTLSPFPFFLFEAKGSSLGFFWITLDLLSSSSSSGVWTAAASFESGPSRSRLFPSILCLSFNSPGPDLTCFSGSSAPTPKLEGASLSNTSPQRERWGIRLTVGGDALFPRVPFQSLSWGPKAFSWASTR